MYSVGLMSGTSLDGVDAALVEVTGCGIDTKIKLIEFITLDIPNNIKDEIKKACDEKKSSVSLICSLNFKLGNLFAEAVKSVCKKAEFPLDKLNFIASHGQTIYHIPKSNDVFDSSTMQIGEPAVIAYETGTQVVSNFRVMDMAAGGEGAPLVPYSEFVLYGQSNESIALQNIGGIGNVTVIPATKDIRNVFAFDTGPGNMIIDEVCQRLFGLKYDDGGKIASVGSINDSMLTDLMNHSYILSPPPKSTGREEFGERYVEELLDKYKNIKNEDILATVTMFTSKSIAENYKRFILSEVDLKKVIIGGGGAHNKTLIEYLKSEIPGVEVITQEEVGFSSDAKEAIAFVILGNETLNGNVSNVPSATGSKDSVILGNITPCPFRR